MTTIRTLPTPPTRTDPASFAARSDAFLAALLGFGSDANNLAAELNALKLANDTSVTSAAAQAAAARDLALAAWGASMAPAEVLPTISQQLHSGSIVKAFFYDTSKDSDGGAWRKRCQDKSWYNESLVTGKWLGISLSLAQAQAAGGTTGDYFQGTDNKFYVFTAPATISEIYRGNRAEFPEQAAIITEASRVIIYDLTQANCPMWMVFLIGSNNAIGTGTSLTSVCAANAIMAFGSAGGLCAIDFIKDTAYKYTTLASTNNVLIGPLSGRNASPGRVTAGTAVIASNTVNAVAITVLPDAPIDVATGLPVPTIAAATNSTPNGVTTIKQDGTTVTAANSYSNYSIGFDLLGNVVVVGENSRNIRKILTPLYSTVTTLSGPGVNLGVNSLAGTASLVQKGMLAVYALAYGTTNAAGFRVYKENYANFGNSMMAEITNIYNTGWVVGDCRGAWLADIVPEVLTASGELVANGTFGADTSGWTPTSATLSVVSGAMRVTATAASPFAYYAVTTVAGRSYRAQFDLTTPTAGKNVFLYIGSTIVGSDLGASAGLQSAGTYSVSFVATGTTTYIRVSGSSAFVSGDYFDVDTVSVKLAEPDRSVKNIGLIVNGSITKAAVATGAQLMGYSNFSAANYLEQPYNANLDFGTGDFCFMGWGNNPNGTSSGAIIDRFDVAQTGNRIYLGMSGGNWVLNCGTNSPSSFGVAVPVGVFHYVFRRIAGVLSLVVNGVSVYSAANTNSVTNAAAVLDIGRSIVTTTNVWPSWLSLLRVSATAPSDDQLAHIYNTEKHLFDANAKCVIDGTSTAITALAYDENEDALHVGTSWGRSKFRDLVRVESAATSVGSITSLSAGQGAHITGGASSARFYQPAFYLREELRRKEEARRALGRMPAFFDFDTIGFTATTTNGSNQLTSVSVITGTPYVGMGVTGSGIPAGTTITNINGATYTISANATASASGVALAQNTFNVPKGFTTKAVYSAGTLKRSGSTKDYVVSTDGFVETVTFGVSPGNAAWVSIMATRSN